MAAYNNIPAPPSGSIVSADPLAQNGAIPPPPSGSIISSDPLNQQPPSDEIQSSPSDNIFTSAAKAAGGLAEGIGEGLFGTVAAGSDLLDTVTGQQRGAVNQELHTLAGDNDASHGTAQTAGRGLESIIEFAMGDEAMKGLSLSEKLAQSSKLAAVLEKNPRLASLFGNALRTGTVGATVGGIHGGTQGAITGGIGGALLGGVGGSVADAASGAKGAVENIPSAVQDSRIAPNDTTPVQTVVDNAAAQSGLSAGSDQDFQALLQNGIRDIATNVANDAGVDAPASDGSIRDAVNSVARGVRASAQQDYQALDEASGGRWQRYDDSLGKINDRLENLIEGVDDDQISNLEQKRNEIETSQAQMIEDLKGAGKIDPDIADRAAAQYRQAMALQDVGKAIQGATKPTVVNGAVQDVVDPNALANRLARLNDTPITGGDSRLVQAVGDENAATLLGHVNQAQVGKVASLTPTGQKAMSSLLAQSANDGRIAAAKTALGFKPSINYLRVYGKFNSMTPAEQVAQFGGEAPLAKQFLASQARKELIGNIGKGAGIAAIAHVSGLDRPLLHTLMH